VECNNLFKEIGYDYFMRESVDKETELFFEQLSLSPIYRRFKEQGSVVGKLSEAIERRVHSFAYFMINEFYGFNIRKSKTEFQDLLLDVMIASLPEKTKDQVKSASSLIEKYAGEYIPEFVKLCN